MSGEWVSVDYLGKPMLVRRLVRSSIALREEGVRSTEELDLKSRTFHLLLYKEKKRIVLVASSSTLAGVIRRVTVTVDRKRHILGGSEGSKRRSSRFLRKSPNIFSRTIPLKVGTDDLLVSREAGGCEQRNILVRV